MVLAIYSIPFGWTAKKVFLLLASYLFYSAWNPPFVILLWVSTIVDWVAAQQLVKARSQWVRRLWMLISVVVNLGMLAYFKYGQFAVDSFAGLLSEFGVHYAPPQYDIVLPVGISFYTFATLSYTLDVYLRRAAPARNFLDYALFVTFFPHLVAGPIMRPTELVPQFAEPRRATPNQMAFGLSLMILGIFQKMVLADGFLAPAVEKVYDSAHSPPGFVDAWVGTLAFSGQIFCDFAGYSTTAIGVAMCMGFAMPDNFRFPYAAIGFSDFWRRWHITLSSWLRDYLYIPLGGSRHGEARTYLALMATMLLGGLWHGANWTFVVWGGLHGLYLVVERAIRKHVPWRPGPAVLVAVGVLTFALTNIAWVFFRAKTFGGAWAVLTGMFGLSPHGPPLLAGIYLVTTLVIVGGIVAAHWVMRNRTLEATLAKVPPAVIVSALTLMAFAIVIEHGGGNAFIYFQF
ncbi:MBOAT family O-acyltransferase [Sphingomonas immobilis]|uniref:Probable alginate O-acetylase AlgI n=1 Tax=Sphingomonas immobilis TaxID=3063997 RepID=A0ABT8ZZ97_9SPHN|nr:MBOAT family protein [Sphingomonas sp. CA1-15]MDO7842908.1 MBOAT family protein [Sphingomonas sp. CA1-15]